MQISHLLEKKTSSNAAQVTLQLIRSLQVPVTAGMVIESIEQHPHYPSLLSISDQLKKWKVDNMALRVEPDQLKQLPVPFIAHSALNGGQFLLVHSVNGRVDYTDEKGKRVRKSREEFATAWDQVVLVAEKSGGSGDKNYRVQKRKEMADAMRLPSIILACLCLIIGFTATYTGGSWVGASTLLFLKLGGSIVTGLLLWIEIDKPNPVLQQICSAGKHTNCTAVLSSRQSKLFGKVSWSEIGFVYFAGSFLLLLTSGNSYQYAISILSLLNVLALPYTAFSVIYQWRIAKQWCPLCLAVQGILLLEFIVCFFGFWNSSQPFVFSTSQLVPALTCFLLPVFFWLATKKVYLSGQDGKRNGKELSRLKYNKDIFHALLTKQKKITASPDGLGITLGNPNAAHTIIKVCNPYCGPCAKAHPIIDEILESNEDVKVQVIFTATSDEGTKGQNR